MIERTITVQIDTKDGTAKVEIRGPGPSGPDQVLGRLAVVNRDGVFGVLGADLKLKRVPGFEQGVRQMLRAITDDVMDEIG
jgi:hypothetical protein